MKWCNARNVIITDKNPDFLKHSKELLWLAVPMLMENILQQLYNTFDVWMVGRYCGYEEYAAVGTTMNL